MRLVVATRSAHKLEELSRMARERFGERLELQSLDDLDPEGKRLPEIVEDAPTFAGNAEKKARTISEVLGEWVLADDSGLCVDALDGAPGIYSARYAGEIGPERDEANNRKLLDELVDVADEDRGAAFVCALCLVAPDGRVWHLEERCLGRIDHGPKGSGGFGYDPLFVSHEPGQDRVRTHGELSAEEKDAISHRGKALRALLPLLETLL
ncbi:MAG: RdgB/HAM1 family non-canonical purine NTP pyrophosphatase [Deltaproteobacteria bacterium]|nr:RdgB/HAM1 family non-canonical purine NTP pyrophosphatase [Deltaproteobacteria bacterium]